MTDYYDLLGLDAGADKDAVRSAYRDRLDGASQSERAKLNKAWNVLSDPVQRGRYDDYLKSDHEFGGDGEDRDDAGGEDRAPARTSKAARGGTPARGGRPARERAPARPPLDPTIDLPSGTVFAAKRARNMALLFDVSVILVIFLACQYAGSVLIRNQYPAETKQIDALTKQIDRADKAQANANKDKQDAEKRKDTEGVVAAGKKSKDAEKLSKRLLEEQTKVQGKLSGAYFVLILVVLIVSLLYVVPMSARSGQTLGKKRQRIRLVRLDGSPPGIAVSLIHYGVPLALAFMLFGVLGPLALILGLGMVLWNLRDRNHQGLHDKLAKTLVVADA